MKEEMSSFDVMAAVAEMQSLVGGRIDQVYQVGRDEVVLRIRTREREKREVYIRAGMWLCLREAVRKPSSPPPFGMTLRKHLANAVLDGIEQKGFERVVVLRLQKRESYELVLELFGRGNIVLVRDGVIVQPMFSQSWKDREVRAGVSYEYPPERGDPLAMSRGDFVAALAASERDLVRALATEANLGGTYAEELCARTKMDKSGKAKELEESQASVLYETLQSIGEGVSRGGQATLVRAQGEIVDVTPVPLSIHESYDREPVETFNQGLAAFLDVRSPEVRKAAPEDDRREKLSRRLENLEAGREELVRRAGRFRSAAEFIYGNFQVVEEALEASRRGEWTDMVRQVDFDRHWVEVDLGQGAIRLDNRLGAIQNADALYQRGKDARKKAESMLEEIGESRSLLVEAQAAPSEAPEAKRPRKTFWFERYRWFISSEGRLVLGGRDAKSNEALVRKRLEPGDRYVHADVNGAPSVVVKEGAAAGKATLDEACQLAVAYSRLWRAGVGSGSAYWVNPEQVSKTPQSGEFLAKGAFVIRGKRNYRRDLPLQAAVGLTEWEGEKVVMGGPPTAVASRCETYVVVSPGEGSRDSLAIALGEEWEVSKDEVVRCLPPGGVRVTEATPARLATLPT